nr:ribonuclease H-like domain, reverse transcriptase, RNA-dependent DNA polymerase [Tanacetum cinerariifolium]
MSYMSDFEELNGGYVAFGGNPKGGKFDRKADEGFLVRYSNTNNDATCGGKKPEFKGRKPESKVYVSLSSSAQTKKHDDKTKREVKGKSHVEFAAGPSNTGVSPTHGKSLYVNTYQYPDDTNMPELEDITYSDKEEDVGAEADFTNLETTITDELLQFKMQKVWVLVDFPNGKRAIGTKWVFRNKKDERGIVVRNKARHVAQGHTQEEGIDYEKVFAQVEEVYVCQPFGLEDPDYPDKTDGKSASTPIDTEKPLLKDHNVKRIFSYLKGKPHLGLWYPKDSPFNLVAYSDNDYARASLDRKSTTRGCQFLGCRLISWQCKKQAVVATSSTNAEKKVIITEATIQEALRLDDAESIDCLPNEEIFTELSRMGSSMASAVICLSIGAAGVDVDVVDEPSISSPTPTTQPPPPSK